ncbi:MAG: NAD(+) synthase [Bacteroidales bacterium]|nr:NAD(+) synthase [Bacteroidales bacterium]
MNPNYGMIRTAAASPRVWLADVDKNVSEICSLLNRAEAQRVSLVAFPELSVTGYTCADLFGQKVLLDAAERGVASLCDHLKGKPLTAVVGVPVRYGNHLYNCAAVIGGSGLLALVPKIHIPCYNEFYETRWFASGADFMDGKGGKRVVYAGYDTYLGPDVVFSLGETSFAVEVCEDLWTPMPPSGWHALAGADIIVNISASNEILLKHEYRRQMVSSQSGRTISGYIYASSGWGESTQDLVFAGSSLICEYGTVVAENKRFQKGSSMIIADLDVEKLVNLRQKSSTFGTVAPDGTRDARMVESYVRIDCGAAADTDFAETLYRKVATHPFVPIGDDAELDSRSREIMSIQVQGLCSRLEHIGCKTAVIGISGGLDSTLALLVAVMAFDTLGWERSRILGITMPGLGTTDRTLRNALDLMAALGVTVREIPIAPAVRQHFSDIGHDESQHDTTYENSQARERTQILMDVANKENGLVVGTGDLSELALGWATYNGDHMSMYGVNAGVPKTLVRYLVQWAADHYFDGSGDAGRSAGEILRDIIDTPISPELIPADARGNIAQKTEDLVGPYELHDFFLYYIFRFGFSPRKVFFLARKAFGKEQYSDDEIKKWLRKFYWRFFSQQFKRSCLPDGPKVGSVSLSPRGDWRMPSDASPEMFLKELE